MHAGIMDSRKIFSLLVGCIAARAHGHVIGFARNPNAIRYHPLCSRQNQRCGPSPLLMAAEDVQAQKVKALHESIKAKGGNDYNLHGDD